jgi:hypothetical protein
MGIRRQPDFLFSCLGTGLGNWALAADGHPFGGLGGCGAIAIAPYVFLFAPDFCGGFY